MVVSAASWRSAAATCVFVLCGVFYNQMILGIIFIRAVVESLSSYQKAVWCADIRFALSLFPFPPFFPAQLMSVMLWFWTKLSPQIWPVNPVCMLH